MEQTVEVDIEPLELVELVGSLELVESLATEAVQAEPLLESVSELIAAVQLDVEELPVLVSLESLAAARASLASPCPVLRSAAS